LIRRFTKAGLLALVLTVMLVGLGADTTLAVAYQIATITGAALLVSFACSFAKRPLFKAERILPRFGTAGSPLQYRVRVTNPTGATQSSLTIMEDLGDPRPTRDQFLNNPEPGEAKRNLFDRTFCFYRWMWLMEQNKLATVAEETLPTLAPGASNDVKLELVPQKRGLLRFEGLTVAFPDPFGFFRSFRRIDLKQSMLILPKRYYIPNLAMPGSMQYQQGGVALASAVGQSDEFVALRDYRRGDPLRHIHWKSVSKTGRLIVKEFQDEFFVRHALILDTFADSPITTADGPEKTVFPGISVKKLGAIKYPSAAVFEEAVSIAASFACTVRTQESLLDLMFVGPQAFTFTIGRGIGHTEQMLEILASVQPCTNKPFTALENLVTNRLTEVSGAICVFIAWDEQRREFVKQIRAMGIPLLVLVVTEPNSKDLDADGLTPDIFRQIEVGKAAESLATL
jgi:uncharacterized protein (DUF58 family)